MTNTSLSTRPSFTKTLVSTLAVGCLLMSSVISSALAATSVGATPLKVVLELDPGTSKSFEIQAINRNDKKLTYSVEVKQASTSDEAGSASFQDAKADDKEAVPNWIKVENKEVTVEPNSMAPVKFSIDAPTGVTPGGHYGMILLSPKEKNDEKGNVSIIGQVGVPLLVQINGKIVEEGKVEDFSLDQQKLKEGDPITFQMKFTNNGNIHLLPEGKVFLKENGQPLTKVAKIKNTDGSEEVVDYLPINPGKGYALPNSKRIYEIQWDLNKKYSNITASYEISYGRQNVQKANGEQTFKLEKSVSIESFTFDSTKGQFIAKLKNNGNVQMPLRGQVNIFSQSGGDAKVTITSQNNGAMEFIPAKESKELAISWDGFQTLTAKKDDSFNAIFTYVLDQDGGKTITSKVNLTESEGFAKIIELFTQNSALPIGAIVIVLAGIIAVFVSRKKKQ